MITPDGFCIFRVIMTLRHQLAAALFLAVCACPLFGQALQPRPLSPAEFISSAGSDDDGRVGVPGMIHVKTSTDQDSAYKAAMELSLPSHVRFALSLYATSAAIRFQTAFARRPSIMDQIASTMNIPKEILQPTAQERTQYQLTIANAMYVPGVLLWPMGMNSGNFQVSFSDIARVFGIGEDTGPEIRYLVDETIEVEIVIYSTQALIVSTPFRGIQAPGAYTITWDGKDQRGKPVGAGEFIAEVRLGSDRIMRKRIAWTGK